MSDLKDLESKIGKVPIVFRDMAEKDPKMYEKILEFDNYIWADGSLSKQTKKILAIAITAAMRDNRALAAQMAGAKNLGVKKEEIEEALRVAFLLSGMPAYAQGRNELDALYK